MLVTPRGLRVNIYSDIMYFDMIWYSEISVLPWLRFEWRRAGAGR